jgi:hypothetical protein
MEFIKTASINLMLASIISEEVGALCKSKTMEIDVCIADTG